MSGRGAASKQSFTLNGGSGTHVDAPAHWVPGGRSVEQLTPRELCRAPPVVSNLWFAYSERGLRERVQVTMNGQNYTSSLATFLFFDKTRVRVSSLVPFGGPTARPYLSALPSHTSASSAQPRRVTAGAMMRHGHASRAATQASACTLLPSPISSPRMQLPCRSTRRTPALW